MDILIWVSIPFEFNVAEIELSLQEPLIELQSDEIMYAKFICKIQYMENK